MTQLARACDRRAFLRGALGLAAAAAVPLPAWAALEENAPDPLRAGSTLDRLVPVIDPQIALYNAHTKERVETRFFRDGGYDRQAVGELNWIMRDWRQNQSPQIDVRLFWALAAIRNAAMKSGHDGEIVLLSGFRSQATNDMLRRQGIGAARNSFHLRARATDFRLEGIPMETTAAYAEWLEVGGIGRYRGSNFVHIDSGPFRTWAQ